MKRLNRCILLALFGQMGLCSAVSAAEPQTKSDNKQTSETVANETVDSTDLMMDDMSYDGDDDMFDDSDMMGDYDLEGEEQVEVESQSFIQQHILAPSKIVLKHEMSRAFADNSGLKTNRSSVQLEYAKFFWDNFYVRLDTKVSGFWNNDHRQVAQDRRTSTREAYVQGSFGDTSIKVGVQTLIWGESEAGAITDVISPRNFSELFFINLEESRLGQSLINIDHFSQWGDWNLFYIPNPEFNELPLPGTAYAVDPFRADNPAPNDGGPGAPNGDIPPDGDSPTNAQMPLLRDDPAGFDGAEWGGSWKKTFGNSDVTLMAANLVENVKAMRNDGLNADGRMVLSQVAKRFSMLGMTFNYAAGDYLFAGEIGKKSSRAFNRGAFELIEKDTVDTALKLEYNLGGNDRASVELVNSHVIDWEQGIQGSPRNANSVVFSWSAYFLNEDLSVNWLAIHTEPYSSEQHSIFTSYAWNDDISFDVDFHYFNSNDSRNSLSVYGDQKQVIVKVSYAF